MEELEDARTLVLRPYGPGDLNLIYSSWANSFYQGNLAHKRIPNSVFHSFHRASIDRFFQRSHSITVVHFEGEPDIIMGWIAFEEIDTHQLIQYIYVKETFKRLGIARRLLTSIRNAKPVIIPRLTEKAQKIMNNHGELFKDFEYIPHLT